MRLRAFTLATAAGLACAMGCLVDIGGTAADSDRDASVGGKGGSGGGGGDWPDGAGVGGSAGLTGGTGGSGAEGGSGGGSAPSWNLYTYSMSTGAWSVPTPLSVAWGSANSPSSGIAAAVMLEHFDRLLVFGENGDFYLRADGAWQPPVPIAEKFPALAGLTLRAVYHVASPPGAELSETITFSANPIAVAYDYKSNDSVVFLDQVTMQDDPPPAAPQASGTPLWDFEIRDPSLYGTAAEYFRAYYGYSNGNLYQFDAAFVWQSWPYAESPFFKDKVNAPDPLSMRAGYFDAKLDRAVLLGP
jgi:hypothetical protein